MNTTTPTPGDGIKRPGQTKKAGSGHRLFDMVLILLLIGAIVFIGYTEWQRQKAAKALSVKTQQLEDFQKNPQKQGDDVAKAVLAKLGNLMMYSTDPAPTVATIVNVDELKKQNPFYNVAKNGDNLIVTKDRAILFDSGANNGAGKILDVVPVQIQPASPTPVPSGSPAAPGASPAVSGSPAPAASGAPATTPVP